MRMGEQVSHSVKGKQQLLIPVSCDWFLWMNSHTCQNESEMCFYLLLLFSLSQDDCLVEDMVFVHQWSRVHERICNVCWSWVVLVHPGLQGNGCSTWSAGVCINYWDMFFVVSSNDSFNFLLGWIECIVIVVVIVIVVNQGKDRKQANMIHSVLHQHHIK